MLQGVDDDGCKYKPLGYSCCRGQCSLRKVDDLDMTLKMKQTAVLNVAKSKLVVSCPQAMP
jgi:hypothetical protein